MRQQEQQLAEQSLRVCVVTFGAGALAIAYVRETGLPWPLLIDPDLRLYKAYGMDQGTWWNVFGPPAFGIYLKLLWRGRHLVRPGRDLHQLGGDVLIDPEGIVRIHHVGVGPADRPGVSTLLEPMRLSRRSGRY